MVINLKTLYDGRIVLISCGAFYISIGSDAVLLNRVLGLKLNCMSRHICKVGVPKCSIDKYIDKIEDLGYSYIVLEYNANNEEIVKIKENSKGQKVDNYVYNTNCNKCDNYKKNKPSIYNKVYEKYLKENEDTII